MSMNGSFTAREASKGLRTAGMQAGGMYATPRTPRNPLLVKDDVGTARKTCYDLPDSGFSYGRPGNQDLEGAREVSMRWVSHTPSSGQPLVFPDFTSLNKKAISAKIATAKDLKHFKKESDFEAATPRYAALGNTKRDAVPSDIVPGFTYGRKVRPSTPIHDVVSNRFADKAEQEIERFYDEFRESQEMTKNHVRKIPLTAASRGHASAAKRILQQEAMKDTKELFKLKKFQNIQAKVSTTHGSDFMGGRAPKVPGAGYIPMDEDFETPQPSAAIAAAMAEAALEPSADEGPDAIVA